MKIYHNPRCKKSRAGLAYLSEKGIEPEIRYYLNETLSSSELKALLKKLGIPAEELVRKQEDYFKKELKGKKLSEEEWVNELQDNPKLIRRPIVEAGEKAVIGDPAENIEALL